MRNRCNYLQNKLKLVQKNAKQRQVKKMEKAFELLEGNISADLLEFLKTRAHLWKKRQKASVMIIGLRLGH